MRYSEEVLIHHARNAYENGEANFQIDLSRCALLVIDMQDEFVKPGWTSSWIPEATRQVGKINEVIAFCREKSIPVIYTVFSNTNHFRDRPVSGQYMPNRFPNLGQDDSWFAEGKVWHELEPGEDEIIIHKPSYGAFYDTPLDTILKRMGKDTVIICGTLTNCCCGTTARQAYERNYYVVFGSDITSTYDMQMQESELNTLRFAFARVLTAEQIMQLCED
jgi:nicotinamidase-related amidase